MRRLREGITHAAVAAAVITGGLGTSPGPAPNPRPPGRKNVSQSLRTIRLLVAAFLAAVTSISAIAVTTSVAATEPPKHGQSASSPMELARPRTTITRPTASTVTASTAVAPPACAAGAPATQFNGQSYCAGYIIGVKTNVYGSGARIVLRNVNAVQVNGTSVVIQGGPSCLQDPAKSPVYCGSTIPTLTVSFAGSTAVPSYGAIIDLYGVTGPSSISPKGYVVKGFCDPDFGC